MYVKGKRKDVELCYSMLYTRMHFIYCSDLANERVWGLSEFQGVCYETF